jgi:hypothetical protein
MTEMSCFSMALSCGKKVMAGVKILFRIVAVREDNGTRQIVKNVVSV